MEIILWLVIMIVIYLGYEIFVIRKDKALENMKNGKELTLLRKRYKLNFDKLDLKKTTRIIALTNAFIISSVVSLVSIVQDLINNFWLQILSVIVVGLILLIPLILLFYSLIGKHLHKIQEG